MIRHLVLLLIALAMMLAIGPHPLYLLPLLLVSASYISGVKWLGLAGLLGFFTFTLGRIPEPDLADVRGMMLLTSVLVLPGLLALDLVLAGRPYRLVSSGPKPVLAMAALITGALVALLLLSRLQRIGVYLNSDPMLQVFVVTSLSLLFAGPILLSGGAPGKWQ